MITMKAKMKIKKITLLEAINDTNWSINFIYLKTFLNKKITISNLTSYFNCWPFYLLFTSFANTLTFNFKKKKFKFILPNCSLSIPLPLKDMRTSNNWTNSTAVPMFTSESQNLLKYLNDVETSSSVFISSTWFNSNFLANNLKQPDGKLIFLKINTVWVINIFIFRDYSYY